MALSHSSCTILSYKPSVLQIFVLSIFSEDEFVILGVNVTAGDNPTKLRNAWPILVYEPFKKASNALKRNLIHVLVVWE